MGSLLLFLFIYVIGGVTFLPLLALLSYYCVFQSSNKSNIAVQESEEEKEGPFVVEKKAQKGWIRLTNQYQPKMPDVAGKLMSGIQSIVNQGMSKPKGMFYAILKDENLICYESEKQQQVVMILNMKEYQVSIYPKPDTEGEVYGRTSTLRLIPKPLVNDIEAEDAQDKPVFSCTLSDEDITCSPTRVLFLNCPRRIDKEDWYFGILDAQRTILDPIKSAQYIMVDNTHFSPTSMDNLIRQVQSNQSYRDTAWLNAVMGRIFLAMYKTDRLKELMVEKLRKKIDKTKRPSFLDEILIRSVDIGESVPFITDPKLISLTPQGEVIVEASVEYRGGLTIEIETNLNWSYSSLMKPIRMNLILAAKLRKLKGKLMFKLKAPPSNRYWLAFFEMPDMEWKITPVVADKQIKWSLVTNAIESRIREVMQETFVLPNMDDTAFCPSNGKGGIFGEYVMKPKQTMHSRSSSISSFASTTGSVASFIQSPSHDINVTTNAGIKENPSVKETHEILNAPDALKLHSRRAESISGITITTTSVNNGSATIPVFDSTQSLPNLRISSTESLSEPSSAHWSNTTLRKRTLNTNNENDEENSIISNSSHSNSIHRLSDSSLDTSSIRSINSSVDSTGSSSSSLLNKKKGLLTRAEKYISKKISSGPDYTPLDDEKREQYAERLAQMRKRSLEKRLDNKLPDSDDTSAVNGNSLNSFVKPEMSTKEPLSPPLPPLPPRYEHNSSLSLDNKPITTEPVIAIPPPLPTTPRPGLPIKRSE